MFIYTPEHIVLAVFIACIVLFWPVMYLIGFCLLAIDALKRTWARVIRRPSTHPGGREDE